MIRKEVWASPSPLLYSGRRRFTSNAQHPASPICAQHPPSRLLCSGSHVAVEHPQPSTLRRRLLSSARQTTLQELDWCNDGVLVSPSHLYGDAFGSDFPHVPFPNFTLFYLQCWNGQDSIVNIGYDEMHGVYGRVVSRGLLKDSLKMLLFLQRF
ncbi:hypothetical protein CIPAW_15G161000 [Carya illinoinensis]|uniref:Uncharacterized protein n=1 Tax=Carya illinoinensis TaxID=32201 RepID=A0A8T1N835_CARIL|nr:hypothetical protein CIPAW_15G161000 [Carya illinoinensis]